MSRNDFEWVYSEQSHVSRRKRIIGEAVITDNNFALWGAIWVLCSLEQCPSRQGPPLQLVTP